MFSVEHAPNGEFHLIDHSTATRKVISAKEYHKLHQKHGHSHFESVSKVDEKSSVKSTDATAKTSDDKATTVVEKTSDDNVEKTEEKSEKQKSKK